MNDWTDPPLSDEADAGEPIPELARLREKPSPSFLHKIRSSINRRMFAADLIMFSVMAFFQTFFDYLKLALQSAGGEVEKNGEES
jgi:hypothetical protein